MQTLFLFALGLTALLTPEPSGDAPIPREIEDEQIQGINKLPYHSTLVPYGSVQEALAGRRDRSSFARSLNGLWKFNWVKRPEERPVDFYKTDYDVSGWKTIQVPSNWQVLGYGTPYYRNAGYIFQKDWPRVMSEPPRDFTAYEERNPVGSYRRTFTVPAAWKGRQTFLKFDGVDAGFFLWINGQKVGYSQNSRNAAEFDVTKYLHPGTNDVSVEVYRFTAGSYMEDMDMWRLSGIFRNVTLWSSPKLHVQDTFVTTDLDSKYRDGTLKVVAKIHNYGTVPSKPQQVQALLFDPNGVVYGQPLRGSTPVIAPGQERTITLSGKFVDPKKWSAETPSLYTAVVSTGEPGEPPMTEFLSHKVGFRKVEIKGRVFMVNGKPVKLKGANRHEHNVNTGHTLTEADMIQDLKVLKQANCNHVRTCHYSDDPRWYELCDEWGIYLVAEANAECHGYYGVLDREPRFEKMIVDRNVANVENFKNHPSVLIWSLGNECGGGPNFRSALKAIQAIDPARPTHYEPFGDGPNNPASIDSHMYTDPAGTERIAQSTTLTKPFYLCEYAHAMNNSMGSIGEYNDLFDKYPALMGGAIWEWEDQGLWNRRDPKRPYIAYGGGFGEKPNDGYFIHKGVVFSDRSPKPHFPEAKRAYQWVGFLSGDIAQVTIKNRFAFTNLSKYDLKWTVTADGATLATGTSPFPATAPGTTRTIRLATPRIKAAHGTEYFLNVAAVLRAPEKWAPKGYEIANGQFALPNLAAMAALPTGPALRHVSRNGEEIVEGNGFTVGFDKDDGTLSRLERDGKNLLLPGGGPKLHLWRAQHRNDDGYAAGGWYGAGLQNLKKGQTSVTFEEGPSGAVAMNATVEWTGKGGFAVVHSARYAVYPDGTITVDNGVTPRGPRIWLARVGVRMLLDKRLSDLTYLARGPMENYADRKRGSDVGRYASTVMDQLTPYSKPQECGNHEDMRWLALGGAGLPGLQAQADGAPLQFSALPYRDEDMEDVPYSVDLPPSKATVLIVSGKTLGVGSAACGPRPLPQYLVDTSPTAFSYTLRLLAPKAQAARFAIPDGRPAPILAERTADGKTVLKSASPIETSVDGKTWRPYGGPVAVDEPTVISIRTKGADGATFTSFMRLVPPPAKLSWKATASSFEAGEGEAQNVLDGDVSTFWHTKWSGNAARPPHSLVIDLNKATMVGRVILSQRRDNHNGRIRDYEIYLSDDGKEWGAAVAKGQLPDRDEPTAVRVSSPRQARFVKLVVLSDRTNGGWASLAEFDVEP